MTHTHTWTRSKRKHKRPPRFFVVCECGETRQAVIQYGYLHTFTTNHPKPDAMKNYSVRLPRKPTKDEVKLFQELLRCEPGDARKNFEIIREAIKENNKHEHR